MINSEETWSLKKSHPPMSPFSQLQKYIIGLEPSFRPVNITQIESDDVTKPRLQIIIDYDAVK